MTSPFAGKLQSNIYRYLLTPSPLLVTHCTDAGKQSVLSHIDVSFEGAEPSFVTTHLKMQLCTSDSGFKRADVDVNLPAEVFSDALPTHLPVGRSIVAVGIPDTLNSGITYRVKIEHLDDIGDLTPIRLSWLPKFSSSGSASNGADSGVSGEMTESPPAFPPMTIVLGRTRQAFAANVYRPDGLHWLHLDVSVPKGITGRNFDVQATLNSIQKSH